jgi:hypothetical protein
MYESMANFKHIKKPLKEIMAPCNHFCTFRAFQRLKLTLASCVHMLVLDLQSTLRLEPIAAY